MATIEFAAKCPKCDRVLQITYQPDTLVGFAEDGSVPAYCVYCDHHWETTDPREIDGIKRLLKP